MEANLVCSDASFFLLENAMSSKPKLGIQQISQHTYCEITYLTGIVLEKHFDNENTFHYRLEQYDYSYENSYCY